MSDGHGPLSLADCAGRESRSHSAAAVGVLAEMEGEGVSAVRLIHGDCLDVLRTLEAGSVDAVVTDPPYPSEFLHLWEPFAAESCRVLRDGGELITLCGNYQLPAVMAAFAKTSLRYWWTCGMLSSASMKFLGKKVCVYWKPALWYVKGKKRRAFDIPRDMVKNNKPEKKVHPWEQGVEWFRHWCECICYPGETVLDPFMGSGTTGVACVQTGRKFIGIEIDEGYFKIAEKRIAEARAAHPLFAATGTTP